MDRYNGVLPLNKPVGITSHDVIYKLRRITGQQKIGHTGTLDPDASGLLLICLGRATKLTQFLTDWDKAYLAELTLGATSDTFDASGIIEKSEVIPNLSLVDIERAVGQFKGEITQRVPVYSAVKVAGQELYKYARHQIAVEAPFRKIMIKGLEIVSYDAPRLTIKVSCSKGTYIRTLADDIGHELGCGAYLSRLERLSLGPFEVVQSLTIEDVERRHQADRLNVSVVPIEKVVTFPIVNISSKIAGLIRNGAVPTTADIVACENDFLSGDIISMADERGTILAIGRAKADAATLSQHSNMDFFSYVRVLV